MNTKKFLVEGILIIFSVFLALGLNEIREYYGRKETARLAIEKLTEELKRNSKIMTELEAYDISILENIETFQANDSLMSTLVSKDGFDIVKLAYKGIDTRIISRTGWEIAKSHDITQYIDFDLATCLINCYNQQDHVNFSRDRILEILADRQINDPNEIRNTLKILHKYYGMLKTQEAILNDHYTNFFQLINSNDY